MPCFFVLDCLVKKLTFMGIIGKTHGVRSAAKPPKKPARKIANQLKFSVDEALAFVVFSASVD